MVFRALAARLLVAVSACTRRAGNGRTTIQAAIDVEFLKLAVGSLAHHCYSADGAVLDPLWFFLGIHKEQSHAWRRLRLDSCQDLQNPAMATAEFRMRRALWTWPPRRGRLLPASMALPALRAFRIERSTFTRRHWEDAVGLRRLHRGRRSGRSPALNAVRHSPPKFVVR